MTAAAAEAWTFSPDPASTREARRRVSDVLEASALDAAAATVALVVSELATNAVLHARTPFEVRVRVEGDVVRVEVHDLARRRPSRQFFSAEASSGRGLQVVEELCAAWGVEPDAEGTGKTVWAEVPISPGVPAAEFDLDAVEDW